MRTPRQAAEDKERLSGEYSRLSEQLEKILESRPSVWLELRKEARSARDADRAWEASEMGIQEMKLKMAMERCEKEISACNTLIKVYEGEARNLF